MAGPLAFAVGGAALKGIAGFQAGKTNARMAKREAQGALVAGVAQEADIRQDARRSAGEAITAMAANGGGLGTGSALTMLREIELESGLDRLRVRGAAANRAAGLKVEGELSKRRGIFDALAAGTDIAGTVVGMPK